ncbi:MAG: LysR family transcriptional regulator [Candidatus Aminicenantes bacterium]|nr:LysR family transcriptional regulator [Candidatus Aminicenantes bacterium]
MVLNVNQLRSFYSAAKSKSITKAAQDLMVTPAAVTSQVKQLEENLGLRLLFRSGNAMCLTASGATVFEKIRKIFEELDDLEVLIAEISKGKSGELRIGCSETAAIDVMPTLITAFQSQYPGIKVIVDRGTTSEMVKSILDHRNELVVARYRPDDTRLKMRFMGRKEITLIAAYKSTRLPRDRISIAELNRVPLIAPIKGSATRDIIVEHLGHFKVSPKVVIETASIALIKKLVQQDEGVGFLCRDEITEELSKKRLREIQLLECSPCIEYGIGYLTRKNLSEASLAFIRMIDKLKSD